MKKLIMIASSFILILMFLPFLLFGSIEATTTAGTATVNGVTIANRTRAAAITPNEFQKAFIDKLSAYAPLCKSFGIYPSVMMAQAILESSWGRSDLAICANNLFGVKAFGGWCGPTIDMWTKEEYDGKEVRVMATWKKFANIDSSVADYCNFCHGQTYVQAGILNATNYYEQITALKNGGYATNSNYVDLVCTIVEQYNLDQWDK